MMKTVLPEIITLLNEEQGSELCCHARLFQTFTETSVFRAVDFLAEAVSLCMSQAGTQRQFAPCPHQGALHTYISLSHDRASQIR